ncbi:hypothetical protein [Mesorhizobium sp.]|uniref:hypothetical protein n=1 Tax=Mesorhizobium sp. TaxID=1871066 RepID=UPI00122B0EAC|nr:hypothetical protein [Mesorhizobium sp.]TIN22891.1 MAG: hypothetical protein E5Y19_30185 [Mesorhizobium sp.]
MTVVFLASIWLGTACAQPTQSPPAAQPESEAVHVTSEAPIVLRVEQAAPFEMASAPKSRWEPYAQPAISAFAALLGAAVGGLIAKWNASAANNQRANEVEIAQTQSKLNDFYGRFRLIAEENKLVSWEFKKRHGGEDFRTLLALLDPTWLQGLSPADKTIVATMVENGVMLRTLIRDKAGLVDPAMLPYLAKVSAHFSMLELAYKGKLEDDQKRFKQYVYPEKLDGVLDIEMKRLSDRIALLLTKSGKRHKAISPLMIPNKLQL